MASSLSAAFCGRIMLWPAARKHLMPEVCPVTPEQFVLASKQLFNLPYSPIPTEAIIYIIRFK